MITAVLPAATLPVNCNPASSVMNFDLDWLDQPSPFNACSFGSQVSPTRPMRVEPVVMPIDIACGQIDILWQLDRKTLEHLATNLCTSPAVLERLADHPMPDVRAAVCENKNTPLPTIWALAKDDDADVRYQIAENYSLPIALICSLTDDENPYVACRAQQTYQRLKAA